MRKEDAETEDYINNWQEICHELPDAAKQIQKQIKEANIFIFEKKLIRVTITVKACIREIISMLQKGENLQEYTVTWSGVFLSLGLQVLVEAFIQIIWIFIWILILTTTLRDRPEDLFLFDS